MLTLLALAAGLTAPQPLAPTGKWVVEYDEDMCVLARNYGDEKKQITLALRPYPMGTETEVILITPGTAADVYRGKAELTLLPAGRVAGGSYTRYAVPKLSGRLNRLTLDQDALEGIEAATALTVGFGGHESYTVALPSIASGMHALKTCQGDLLKSWGIDPAERTLVVTPPKGNPVAMFNSRDYPPDAIRAHEQGRVIAIGTVGETGAVTTCAVASTSHSLSLDKATCDVLRKKHFSPGRDKDGKPIMAHVVVPVRWALPGG